MWLVFALITFFAWGAADLFYKKGAPENERYSHLKTSIVVGVVMGATAIFTLLTKDLNYDWRNILVYLPVSAMYILSMTVGYFGFRYLQVSIASPIQNASGAVSAILLMIVLREIPDGWTLTAIAVITLGVVILGVLERREESKALKRNERHYAIGFVAFLMPILYCVLDALGTFFDGWFLDDVETTPLLGVTEDTIEDVANVSYQMTFLFVAVLLLIYICMIRRERFFVRPESGEKLPVLATPMASRVIAALFETGGQLAYVYALSGNGIAAAPVIASYCVASLVFGRIFLREKLGWKQYVAIGMVIAGIIIMGVLEGLGEG